jgi:hypothetical protein
LSFKNSAELNNIIDKKLPAERPPFMRSEIHVAGQAYDIYHRDIIQCIRTLFGSKDFDPVLALAPERHYEDATKTNRYYDDMHTGRWWWDTQVSD